MVARMNGTDLQNMILFHRGNPDSKYDIQESTNQLKSGDKTESNASPVEELVASDEKVGKERAEKA